MDMLLAKKRAADRRNGWKRRAIWPKGRTGVPENQELNFERVERQRPRTFTERPTSTTRCT